MALSLILCIAVIINAQSVIEEATLTVSQGSDNSAQVSTRNIGYSDSINGWTLTVNTHQGYNWKINFQNNIWKFQSDRPSTLTLKVYSNSAFNNGAGDDRDMLVSFGQDDSKYITSMIHLDGGYQNSIYPSCDKQSVPTASFANGDIEALLDANDNGQDRAQKSMGYDPYIILLTPSFNSSSCCTNQSPMIFKLINNPIDGYSKFIYTNPSGSGWKQECGFRDVWDSDKFMEIFISGHDMGETLNIYQLDLSMEYDLTLDPTQAPISPSPSTSPTG